MSLTLQMQISESLRNGKTTLEKGGKNPPDVTLEDVVKDLLLFFDGFQCLHDANNEIEKKYVIEREHGDCWPADDIKRAWGKTQRMEIKSSRRKHWARVIMLQVIKRRLCYDVCKRKEEPSDLMEHENLGHSTLSLSDLSEQMEAERENGRWEAKNVVLLPDDNQACGTEQSLKGETRVISTKPNSAETKRKTTKGTQRKKASKSPEQNSGAAAPTHNPTSQTQPSTSKKSVQQGNVPQNKPATCIRIPLSVMSDNEPEKYKSTSFENRSNAYTLIDRVPSRNEIRKRKSYIMSYNKETKNAVWVYEILNRSTLENRCKEHMCFGRKEFEDEDYNQGHLAAAANHRWCQEAYHDTFLMSNMVPQNKSLNEGLWSELENYCREKIKDDNVRNVHVYTGPLYLGNELLFFKLKDSRIRAVPTHLFKVVIVENSNGTVEEPECYVMPKVEKTIPHQEKGEKEEEDREEEEKEEKQTQIELLKEFRTDIKYIENQSKIKFIDSSRCNPTDITVKWTGEDKNRKSQSVEFVVKVSQSKK